jgi:ubiquinone/menaquinone biosynthesis C-methylase UbiE
MGINMFNENKIILDLCGGTGSWSKPYSDNGYDVRIVLALILVEVVLGIGRKKVKNHCWKGYQ